LSEQKKTQDPINSIAVKISLPALDTLHRPSRYSLPQ
jgi:hypothetical protein